MAQENANLCHAAIAFAHVWPQSDPPEVVTVRAQTGIELASVKRRTDVVGVPLVYEFDLIDPIADDDLIILCGQGPHKPDATGAGGPPSPSTVPINVQRATGDTTQRRFWILIVTGEDLNCYVQFNRIAPLDAPRAVTT